MYSIRMQKAWKCEQESISQTFYEQLFCTKVFCAAFLQLQFGSIILWSKNIGAIAAQKMLMELTQVVNFKNILRVVFYQ